MDLTTTARVKAYTGVTTSTQDALIGQLVTRASGQIAKYCTRRFDRQTYSALLNGNDGQRLFMPNTPVVAVSSLVIGNTTISVSSDGIAAGYQFDTRMLYLFGAYRFYSGMRNVKVGYTVAFTATETDDIPSGTPTITPTTADENDGAGWANVDLGVVFTATGVALTSVASAPAAGQYSFSGGTYTFNSSDANKSVTMSYDYVPSAVEQACIEMVALKLKQKDNIGIQSKTLANETVVYTDRDMTKSVRGMLDPYNRRVPA